VCPGAVPTAARISTLSGSAVNQSAHHPHGFASRRGCRRRFAGRGSGDRGPTGGFCVKPPGSATAPTKYGLLASGLIPPRLALGAVRLRQPLSSSPIDPT
jgi:hypothetical protein